MLILAYKILCGISQKVLQIDFNEHCPKCGCEYGHLDLFIPIISPKEKEELLPHTQFYTIPPSEYGSRYLRFLT